MNPVVIVHFLCAVLTMVVAVPLIRRRIKMNEVYGVKIAPAFASDEAWFELNHYGGKLLFRWGLVIALTALIGLFIGREYWATYNWCTLVPIFGGLMLVLVKIYRYARVMAQAPRRP